jgi:hypothetical protein
MSLVTEALAARKRPHFMHNASEIRPSSDNTATFMDHQLGIERKSDTFAAKTQIRNFFGRIWHQSCSGISATLRNNGDRDGNLQE